MSSNDEIMKQIQNLTNQMNGLLTKVGITVPTPTAIVAMPEPVAEEKDTPLTTGEKLAALYEQAPNMEEFCKYARTQFGMFRNVAREHYRCLVEENAKKVGAKPKEPAPKAEVTRKMTVVVPPAPEALPVIGNALLQGLTDEVKKLLGTQGQIPAIKFIRDRTGMDLLPAKFWVDSIEDTKIPLPPIVQGALQAYLQKQGIPVVSTLNAQVQSMRKEQVSKTMDSLKAMAEKQHKIDIAGDNKSMLVQAARKVARELGVKGPISIDDVTLEMSKSYNVLPIKGKRHNWKGSVFTSTEWVFIGSIASRQVSAHCRPVGMWALKAWLQDNTLNGKETHVSSFVVSRLYSDFKRINPRLELKNCNCYIGDERVAAEIRDNIKKSGNRLYEIPVSWIPGAVGALIMPPEPQKVV